MNKTTENFQLQITFLEKRIDLKYGSENEYYNIAIKDKNSLHVTVLHIGFSKELLRAGRTIIDIEKTLNEEIEKLIIDTNEKLFNAEEYFVYFYIRGIIYERLFPFLK